MNRIEFKCANEHMVDEITIEFDSDETIEQQVCKFRTFLLAQGYGDGSIDNYIKNVYTEDDSVMNRRPLTINVHVEDKEDVPKIIKKLLKKSEIKSSYM